MYLKLRQLHVSQIKNNFTLLFFFNIWCALGLVEVQAPWSCCDDKHSGTALIGPDPRINSRGLSERRTHRELSSLLKRLEVLLELVSCEVVWVVNFLIHHKKKMTQHQHITCNTAQQTVFWGGESIMERSKRYFGVGKILGNWPTFFV